MRRSTCGIAAVTLLINLVLLLSAPRLAAQPPEQHPRIWLSQAKTSELVERFNRNTYNADRLRSWCDTNINAPLDGYLDSRALGMLKAVNYALMYQLTGGSAYAGRAVQIIEYGFAHPHTGYTIDSWPSFDNFYTDRYLVPATALVLDWCWDDMSETQRNNFIEQLDYWANYIITSTPWAWQDASNNYYYGHAWAIMTAAYAIYHHSGNAPAYLATAKMMLGEGIKYTNGEEVPWPVSGNTTGRASGGMWNEGTSYGSVNHDFIFSMVLAVREAEDPAAYPEFDFGDDVVKFHIYSTHPDGRTLISEGDGAGTMTIDDKIRVPVVLATALASEPVKGYGQYWLNNYSSFTTADYKLYNEFIWYDDQLQETDYRGVLPDAYHADGSQILVWREGWDSDDCYMTLRIGLLNTDHAHNGLGTFSIYDDGALVPDKASATNGRELFSDIHHSVVFIQPTDDRKLYWGASTVEHLANTNYYLYYAGDMSDPYLAQPSYRNNTVSHKEREFLLIKEEKVLLIMDRAASYDAATEKVFQVYLDGTPSASGDDYRSSNGMNDLLIHTSWPPGANTSDRVNTLPLFEVRYPQDQRSNTFLHILKVAPRGGDLNASDVTSSDQSVVAAAFQSASDPYDYLVAFSNDLEGDVPGASQFTLTYSRFSQGARIYVMNLRPNTNYYMNTGADGATATVTVSTSSLGAGFSQMTDDNGIFYAQVSLGDAPAPAPTPDGVQMDKRSGQ